MARQQIICDSEDELPGLAELLRSNQTKSEPGYVRRKIQTAGAIALGASVQKEEIKLPPNKQRVLKKVDNNARSLGPFTCAMGLATATEERQREVRKSLRKPRTIMKPIAIIQDDENSSMMKTEEESIADADETYRLLVSEESDDETIPGTRHQFSPVERLWQACAIERPNFQSGQNAPPTLDLSNPFLRPRVALPSQSGTSTSTSRPTSSSSQSDTNAVLHYTPQKRASPVRRTISARPTPPPPSSPSKKLTSPSKARFASIPPAPLRESLDAFWSQDHINDWNEQYSPKKLLTSPRKNRFATQASDDEIASPPSPSTSPRKRSPQKCRSPTKESRAMKKAWEERKKDIAEQFLKELDDRITDGKIAELSAETGGVQIVWSKKLNSTAGRANWRREGTSLMSSGGQVEKTYKHYAHIELAEKVVDEELKLINVVAHEFCHLANFMVSGIKNNPHGKEFKQWARKCSRIFGDRGIDVTTKHSYDIDYKYIWECCECGHEFKRHSKSICPEKQACGTCKGKLVQTKPTVRANVKTSEYQLFVKEHYQRVKRENCGAAHGVVMELLGRSYREQKTRTTTIVAEKQAGFSNGSEKADIDSVDVLTKELEIVVLDD